MEKLNLNNPLTINEVDPLLGQKLIVAMKFGSVGVQKLKVVKVEFSVSKKGIIDIEYDSNPVFSEELIDSMTIWFEGRQTKDAIHCKAEQDYAGPTEKKPLYWYRLEDKHFQGRTLSIHQ